MSDNESQLSMEYNPVLCKERMDRLRETSRNTENTLRSEITNGLSSVRTDLVNCRESIINKIEAENQLEILKDAGYQKAITEALARIDLGMAEQDARIENLKMDLRNINLLIPNKCINRLSNLESERKYIVGLFGASGLVAYLFYKYIEHVLVQHAETLAQASSLIEQLKDYTGITH